MTAELDIEQKGALVTYLRRSGHLAADETPEVVDLRGGVSNRTVLVRRGDGTSWVLKQALPRLRVEVDWFSSPERTQREAEGLRWLRRLAPPGTIPRLVFEDPEHHLLAMEAVPRPHRNWKELLLEGRIEDGHVEAFGRLLGTIHRNAFLRAEEVAAVFTDRSFFEELRLEPYYRYSADREPAAAAFLDELIRETRSLGLTLVHGDYSPKNILVHAGRLILLDHEVIHVGDPAFDLGFSLTHLLSKGHHLPRLRQAFLAAAGRHWESYLDALGAVPWRRDLEARAVRHTLACLLARVSGRSPLEYLSSSARAAQRRAVLALLTAPPGSVGTLIRRFAEELP